MNGPAPTAAARPPGSEHRPLDLADILDRAVELYRRHFLGLAVIPLVTSGIHLAVVQVIQIVSAPVGSSPVDLERLELGDLLSFQSAQIWLVVLASFLNLWAVAALVHAVSRRYLGLECSWRESLRAGLDRLPYLALTSLALMVAMGVAVFFLLLPAFALVVDLLAGLVVLLLCLAPLAGAFLVVLWMWLHGAAVVIEGRGARDALERSRSLMRRRVLPGATGRNDLRLSVLVLVLPTIAMALASLVMLPALGIALLGGLAEWLDVTNPDTLARALQGPLLAGQLVSNALYQPLAVAVTVLFYYDLRYRSEGLDLELRGLDLAFAGRRGVAQPG